MKAGSDLQFHNIAGSKISDYLIDLEFKFANSLKHNFHTFVLEGFDSTPWVFIKNRIANLALN